MAKNKEINDVERKKERERDRKKNFEQGRRAKIMQWMLERKGQLTDAIVVRAVPQGIMNCRDTVSRY